MSEKVLTIAEYIQACGGAACGLTRLRELRSDMPLLEHEQAAYDACVAACPNAPCVEARSVLADDNQLARGVELETAAQSAGGEAARETSPGASITPLMKPPGAE